MSQVMEWMASIMPIILSIFSGSGGYGELYHEFWCYLFFFYSPFADLLTHKTRFFRRKIGILLKLEMP